MAAIKPEFEEYGVSEDVLAELQNKWENKVIASHVADFEVVNVPPPQAPQHHPYQAHMVIPGHPGYAAHNPYTAAPAAPAPSGVKAEPLDTRYMLSAPQMAYALPHLPGPVLNGARPNLPPHYGGQTSVLSFPPGPPAQALPTNGNGAPLGRPYVPQASTSAPAPPPASTSGGGGSGGRIPQLDGPSEEDSDEDSQTPPPYASRSTHPSLPQPQASTSASADEAINSDLDDSDTGDEEEADEGAVGETDIVFCTYDKVARVKNKWKCILKDGMIHVNGKDYLFSKCTGEFEW
ncbi:transcription factor IIA, alpha/beta subunit-domain-containing protein [Rhodocollybia butyracea]|uniref:Transcription factor IIA, alpha/beta subunit-domain-containing protein n=1 Tax=Rhodocollybia butyracea TaxID=206335 RepID=A0A9P5PHE5_9AGAR|nr:transcription factor IIA, alpha/beta subunit-domain-containing protein [Rhodocollybia butyracea]